MVNLEYIDESNLTKVKVFLDELSAYSYETFAHSKDVANRCLVLGKKLGLDKEELKKLYTAGLMHDIGKLDVPRELLHKPCTPEEVSIIRDVHMKGTKRLLTRFFDSEITSICMHHHERLDGSGYPAALKADEQTLLDRILQVADVCSALVLYRSCKETPISKEDTIRILNSNADQGKLDKAVTDSMVEEVEKDSIIDRSFALTVTHGVNYRATEPVLDELISAQSMNPQNNFSSKNDTRVQ